MSFTKREAVDQPEFYPGPTRDRVAQTMANLEKEIAWTEHRLETLVLSKEDRDQTLDMLDDLKSELLSLRRCFPNG